MAISFILCFYTRTHTELKAGLIRISWQRRIKTESLEDMGVGLG
jgi:hypothetical protein